MGETGGDCCEWIEASTPGSQGGPGRGGGWVKAEPNPGAPGQMACPLDLEETLKVSGPWEQCCNSHKNDKVPVPARGAGAPPASLWNVTVRLGGQGEARLQRRPSGPAPRRGGYCDQQPLPREAPLPLCSPGDRRLRGLLLCSMSQNRRLLVMWMLSWVQRCLGYHLPSLEEGGEVSRVESLCYITCSHPSPRAVLHTSCPVV